MNEEEKLEEIKVLAERIYPGRTWEDLSVQEQAAVYKNYDAEYGFLDAIDASADDALRGKQVGDIYAAASPWASLAGGLAKGYSAYRRGKLGQQESAGRQAMADLITNRDARDRVAEEQRAAEEERRRMMMMRALFRGAQ